LCGIGPDGRLYAFRGQKVYTFHADGVGVEHVHEDARDVFPGAPRNVRAAVYDLPNNKVYMFKGTPRRIFVSAWINFNLNLFI